jgi:predicted  nucleic acid-binding Zn-ribbon protein
MKNQLVERLKALKDELDKGNQVINQKQQELVNLQQTILRIQGAVQVLDEEIKKFDDSNKAV